MKRSATLLAIVLLMAACGTSATDETTTRRSTTTASLPATATSSSITATTAASSSFPITVEADNGAITIEEEPQAIISLSSTATEMLFAIGAGSQVIAVDDQSNYPEEAPVTDLSGFTPNVEAILSYEPDLVVVGFEPGGLVDALTAARVPVLFLDAAKDLNGTHSQITTLGAATGHDVDAAALNKTIERDLEAAIEDAPDLPEGTDYYHEVDNTLYTATSSTFIGQIYTMFGLENIADAADEDGSAFGYPQLSSEYVVSADPDLIFLADSFYGEDAETLAERPGWDVLTAVQEGNVVELNSDIVSRWGPRIVDFAESVSAALETYVGQG